MKFPICYLLAAVAALSLASCNREEEAPANCSVSVPLGTFLPDHHLPYDSFQYLTVVNELGETDGISINHPSNLAFHNVEQETREDKVSNCEVMQTVEKHSWTVDVKNALLLFVIQNSVGHSLQIKSLPLLDETSLSQGMVGEYLEFYDQAATGGVSSQPFMRIQMRERVAGKGAAFEFGATFLPNVELAGKTYTNVWTNTVDLTGSIKRYYYHREEGVIGWVEADGAVWRLAD